MAIDIGSNKVKDTPPIMDRPPESQSASALQNALKTLLHYDDVACMNIIQQLCDDDVLTLACLTEDQHDLRHRRIQRIRWGRRGCIHALAFLEQMVGMEQEPDGLEKYQIRLQQLRQMSDLLLPYVRRVVSARGVQPPTHPRQSFPGHY